MTNLEHNSKPSSNTEANEDKMDGTETSRTHWHILGAGAIGCLMASYLQDRSTLLLKENMRQTNASNQQITLSVERNKQIIEYTLLASSVEHCNANHTKITHLLICTKANQTEAAIQNINMHSTGHIVLLQNGMGNINLLKQYFPKCSIYAASTSHGAFKRSNFHIVHAGIGQTYLGSLNGSNQTQTKQIAALLSTKKNQVTYDDNINQRLWKKLAINCVINPLTAIYQCNNGELLKEPKYYTHVKKLCKELDTVLHSLNIISQNENILPMVKNIALSTANNLSSMYQDKKHKRPSEIDYIQGYLCQQAKQLNIPCPENAAIFTTIKEIEAKY